MKTRIQKIIDELGLTKAKFAEIIGVSAGAITQWTNGRQNVNDENLEKILAKFPQINKDWLYSGNGKIFRNDNYLQQDLFSNSKNNNNVKSNNNNNLTTKNKNNTDNKLQNIIENETINKKIIEKIIFIYNDQTFKIIENSEL